MKFFTNNYRQVREMFKRQLREHTFKSLFVSGFYAPEEIPEQIDNYLEDQIPDEVKGEESISRAADRQEVKERALAVLEKVPELDEKIASISEGWKISRIGKLELNILRLAAYEILFDDAIDAAVAINEAVELAKKYGDDGAPKFINGVLAKLVK